MTIDLTQTALTKMPSQVHAYVVKAEVLQDSQVKATATGKPWINRPWQQRGLPHAASSSNPARKEACSMAPDPLTPYGNRPMVTPIVNAVNYEYSSFEVLRQITDGQIDGYTYHRDDNPTVREAEPKIASLEGAEDCVVCTTGMAACTMVYLTYLRAGDHMIIFHNTYGANYKVALILERLGVEVTWVNADDADKIGREMRPNTRMVFLETPSNPLCKIINIAALRQAADAVEAMIVVRQHVRHPVPSESPRTRCAPGGAQCNQSSRRAQRRHGRRDRRL